MKYFLLLAFLAISLAKVSFCQSSDLDWPSDKRRIRIIGSMPFVNVFDFRTKSVKETTGGFLGLAAGLEWHVTKQTFYKLGGGVNINYPIPVPVGIDEVCPDGCVDKLAHSFYMSFQRGYAPQKSVIHLMLGVHATNMVYRKYYTMDYDSAAPESKLVAKKILNGVGPALSVGIDIGPRIMPSFAAFVTLNYFPLMLTTRNKLGVSLSQMFFLEIGFKL